MNAFNLLYAALLITIIQCRTIHSLCDDLYEASGIISVQRQVYHENSHLDCWNIVVPENKAFKLRIKKLDIDYEYVCPTTGDWWRTESYRTETYPPYRWRTEEPIPKEFGNVFVELYFNDTHESYRLYPSNKSSDWTTIRRDADLSLRIENSNNWCVRQTVKLEIEYFTESGIKAIPGIREIREKVGAWMKSKFVPPIKWKENVQRAVVALHLADSVNFSRTHLFEELFIKQVDLKSSVALLRNQSDPVSLSKLAMIINALLASCHNPRQFYGYDLIKTMKNQAELTAINPAAYLALCNANETVSINATRKLCNILTSESEYPFLHDIQAISVMALSCIRSRNADLRNITDPYYTNAIKRFQREQMSDGSFGNVYSTAVITQALMSNDRVNRNNDIITSAVKFLLKHLNTSTIDFLSAYYSLPVLNGKSLLDVGYTDCSRNPRRDRDGGDITDIEDKLGPKFTIQYSLLIGDKRDIVHTISLRVPHGITAYEVMRLAAAADRKYRFEWKMKSGMMYIYQVASIANDPEDGQFWLMYYKDNNNTGIKHATESPDKIRFQPDKGQDGLQLILWYKTVHV